MNYTRHWNSEFINTTNHLNISKKIDMCLEIGCFEGLTSNYIVENLLKNDGKLICVDPLTDQYLNIDLKESDVSLNKTDWSYFKNQYERFTENTNQYLNSGKIKLYRNISSEIYTELIDKYENSFDLIYIDGDHRATYVYIDAVNCFKLCKSNGIIIFDDYTWGDFLGEERTKNGVDKFLSEYSGQYQTIMNGYQNVIRKK